MQDSPDYTPFKPKSQKQPGSPASFQLQTEYACLSEEDDNESHQGTPKTERRSKKPVDSSSLSGPFFFSVWPYFLVSQSCPTLCILLLCMALFLSLSVVSNSLQLCGLKPARLLCKWAFSREE